MRSTRLIALFCVLALLGAAPWASADVLRHAAEFPPRTGATVFSDGALAYVAGGERHVGNGSFERYDDVHIVDPATGSVTLAEWTLPEPRAYSTAVWTGDVAYLIGGCVVDDCTTNVLRVHPASGTVVEMGALFESGRARWPAVWDGSGALLFNPNRNVTRYDPVEDAFEDLGTPIPNATQGVVAAGLRDGIVWVAMSTPLNNGVWTFDLASRAWTKVGPAFADGYDLGAFDGRHLYAHTGGVWIAAYDTMTNTKTSLATRREPGAHVDLAYAGGRLVSVGRGASTIQVIDLDHPSPPRAQTQWEYGGVTVSWSRDGFTRDPIVGWRVYDDAGDLLLDAPVHTMSFTQTGLAAGEERTYQITTLTDAAESAPKRITGHAAAPTAPPRLDVHTCYIGDPGSHCRIPATTFGVFVEWRIPLEEWDNPTPTSFLLSRASEPTAPRLIATLAGGWSGEYYDTECVAAYCTYQVIALNPIGPSEPSNAETTMRPGLGPLP